jgi:hypothetical protein
MGGGFKRLTDNDTNVERGRCSGVPVYACEDCGRPDANQTPPIVHGGFSLCGGFKKGSKWRSYGR